MALHPSSLACALGLLAALAFVPACTTEGRDADCPEMPVTKSVTDPELIAWRVEAEAKGCVTPIDKSSDGSGSSGGAGGQGGGGAF